MRNRRLTQLPTSDDDDDGLPPPPPRNSTADVRKRKKVHLPSDDDEEEIEDSKMREQYKKKKKKRSDVPEPEPESENEEQEDVEAQPVGEAIRFSGKGRGRRSHFESFEYDGIQYQLVSFCALSQCLFLLFRVFGCKCNCSTFSFFVVICFFLSEWSREARGNFVIEYFCLASFKHNGKGTELTPCLVVNGMEMSSFGVFVLLY